MKLHEAQGRVRELNRLGAEIGRELADASGRTVIVAGSVGPTGEIMEPVGSLSHALAVEVARNARIELTRWDGFVGQDLADDGQWRCGLENWLLWGRSLAKEPGGTV